MGATEGGNSDSAAGATAEAKDAEDSKGDEEGEELSDKEDGEDEDEEGEEKKERVVRGLLDAFRGLLRFSGGVASDFEDILFLSFSFLRNWRLSLF